MRLLLFFVLGVACSGCLVSTRNACDGDLAADPESCRRCASDDDCIFQGNPCEGVVVCAHREVGIVSTDLGCEPEPSPPGDADAST